MHHIYHTQGIILSNRNFGESGKYYNILTRDLGLIRASAQGVRKIESKLRYVLQDGSFIELDLVRGRDFWKITTASKKNELERFIKDSRNFQIFNSISKLLKRLLPGEEIDKKIFFDFIKGLKILENSKNEEKSSVEIIIVLRILYHLGYVSGDKTIHTLTKSSLSESLVFEVSRNRSNILKEINRALKETHL